MGVQREWYRRKGSSLSGFGTFCCPHKLPMKKYMCDKTSHDLLWKDNHPFAGVRWPGNEPICASIQLFLSSIQSYYRRECVFILAQRSCVLIPCHLLLFQCPVGHWDWPADDDIYWTHWRCHESVSRSWHQTVCLWCLWCFSQALGCPRRDVPADLYRTWVWHQCHMCEFKLYLL